MNLLHFIYYLVTPKSVIKTMLETTFFFSKVHGLWPGQPFLKHVLKMPEIKVKKFNQVDQLILKSLCNL